MVAQRYRWDFIGLSTDEKPTASTSPKVTDGSTYYCSDNSKLYVWYKNQWYERKALGGGGGGGGSYTAGTGIDITDDTISVDTTTIQEKLTAGTNVTISDNTISATDTTYTAGTGLSLTGTVFSADTSVLATQNDLSSKQNTLTAGSNITISDNTISATDTTYSNFVGTDGTAAGTAGLVPAPATTDAGKFLKADGTWDTAGGGSGPTVVQTTGTSTTDVMSQNATTSLVYADPATRTKIKIGDGAYDAEGTDGIEIGHNSKASSSYAIGIGSAAEAKGLYSVAIGYSTESASNGVSLGFGAEARGTNSVAFQKSLTNAQGQVQFELASYANTEGYNNTQYRLLSGLYDPQNAHDAATKGYVDPTTDSSAPTTATVGRLGQIFIDTTNADAYMCVAVDSVTPSYTWKKINA